MKSPLSKFVLSALFIAVILCACIPSVHAGTITKPLNTWAQTQATVYNSDYDNIVHIDIDYNLTSLWLRVLLDGSIDLGEYHSRARIHEVTYFWVVLYRVDSPSGYVSGTEGEGNQYIGGYYWGLFAQDPEEPLHCSLKVPSSYGTGQYRVEVKTRLGTWDGSYADNYMRGPQFRVDRFQSALPVPSGCLMTNPDLDSTIKVVIPAYSTFPGYNPSFPPSRYMIEISKNSSFPWDDGTDHTTCYVYPEAEDEAMTVYMNVAYLNRWGIPLTLYGRIKCLGPDNQYWTASAAQSLGTSNVTYWATRLPNVTDYLVDNIAQDNTVEITISQPQYTDFIAEAQSNNPQVKVFFVHSSVYATYQNDEERLMTAAQTDKVYTIPIDIESGAGAVTVMPLVPFTDTGTYYYCGRSTADGFTPGVFTTWQSIQVDHLDTVLPTIPADKWTVDNTGSDPDIKVTVNHYSEFIGTSDMFETYEVKIRKSTTPLTDEAHIGYAYKDVVTETGKPTEIPIDLRNMRNGSGEPLDILSEGAGNVLIDIRCVGEARTPGAYSGEKTITISYTATRLPAVTTYWWVTNPGEDTTVKITILFPNYSNFIPEAQSNNPRVNLYLVHESVYSIYQNDQNKLMTATEADKVYVVPVDILEGVDLTVVTPTPNFTDTGTYYCCARSMADGFTPGAFSAWRNSIRVDHLGTAFPTIPQGKWFIDNTGSDPAITVTVNPYSEFAGSSDPPETYEVKVTKDSLTAYAYQDAEPSGEATIINFDLRDMGDGSGAPVNILQGGGGTVSLDIRCVDDGRTPGAYSGVKTIEVDCASSRLQNPSADEAQVVNDDNDRAITVIVSNYDPINLGLPVPPETLNWKDTRHTGYAIDICADNSFDPGATFRFNYNYDFEGDEIVDEIKASLPGGNIKIDIDLDLAREALGDAFIDAGGTVYVRVIAIRDGYAENLDDIPNFTVTFQNITRLENPLKELVSVYNKEIGNPIDKIDRTITVEIANYDPSEIPSGINMKNAHHTGYQIEICKDQTFNYDSTFRYYYAYDPDGDGAGNEIGAASPDEPVRINIDLNLARTVLGEDYFNPTEPHTVYIRITAIRQGYAVNYDDMPAEPFLVIFLDKTFLIAPQSVSALNPRNPNAGDGIDSSILVVVNPAVPGSVAQEGYIIKVSVTGSDGKTYSKTDYIGGLVPDAGGNIPEVRHTIDIRKLFEESLNPYMRWLLDDFIGIPNEEIRDVSVTVASVKEGYTSSTTVIPGLPLGVLDFKNTGMSFLPMVTGISVSNPGGISVVRTELGPYPFAGIPSYAPPSPASYEIQYSSSASFPPVPDRYGNFTLTAYADASTTSNIIVERDVRSLLEVPFSENQICVHARLLKEGYTPGPYSNTYVITVTVPPPKADFTASPTNDELPPLTVHFTSQSSGEITTNFWDFGDGIHGSGSEIDHTYTGVGSYTVTLTVEGPGGSDVMTKTDYITIQPDIAIEPGESIQNALNGASAGDTVYIFDGVYEEDISIEDKGSLAILGESALDAVINGNIIVKDSNPTLENLTIKYKEGEGFSYTNEFYPDITLINDAGITSINSEVTVKGCIIMPDPDVFGGGKYGKGVAIWNLYDNPDIAPFIDNCEISNTDTGIYLFSQAFGGAILGEISNNTLDNNNYGITLRMHKEKPLIRDNEITNSINGIHISYEDGTLLQERLDNIINNTFSGNTDDIWCDELQN